MPTTSNFGLRYPTSANAANVPLDIQNLAEDVDADLVTTTALIASTAAALTQGETVGYWPRSSTSSNSTGTDVGVIRIDGMALKTGKLYAVRYACHPDSNVSTDQARVQIRFSTSGNATTSSAILDRSSTFQVVGNPRNFMCGLIPSSDQTYSMLLCVGRSSGTGNVNLFGSGSDRGSELHIFECGTFTASGTSV